MNDYKEEGDVAFYDVAIYMDDSVYSEVESNECSYIESDEASDKLDDYCMRMMSWRTRKRNS